MFSSMNVFYMPDIQPGEIVLNREESGHAIRVLRLRERDRIILVNGKGTLCEAEIVVADPVKCRARIVHVTEHFGKQPYRLHLAVAPTRNHDRMEWLIEKATEIGLDEFTPLLCRYSERKQVQTGRLEKVAIAAMKQSVKAYLPVINNLITFSTFISGKFKGKKFIAHCYAGDKPHLTDLVPKNEEIVILTGPEGDFSSEEIEQALHHGFREVSLGRSRLRTETAALTACHTVSLCNR